MKLSLCITTYNRPELTIKAFEKVYNDPRIDEVVIVDDCSTLGNRYRLTALCEQFSKPYKIKLVINEVNIGMSRNKARAIELAKNDWCILFDSDNVLDVDYLDAFYDLVDKELGGLVYIQNYFNFIFCPDFAKPNFDYTKYDGLVFAKWSASRAAKEDEFNCLLNTCNYVVNRDFYLKTYQHNPRHIASDTIWHNYNHLKAGGAFKVVPNMQYDHLVHDGSGFMQDAAGNMARAAEVRKLIMQM